MLDQERAYFDSQLSEWLAHHAGKFVLVKGSELIGFFDTLEDALAEGARRFGTESFLVRRIEPRPAAVNVPALTLGLLGAHPAHSVRR